ncbi:MAG: alanine racemase [Flavobacteriaceae bacterium]
MTQLKIDLGRLHHNFTTIKKRLKAKTKIIAVVKANAYGLGAVAIAKQLEALKVDWLAVAYAHEGIELRQAGIKSPILVFYPQLEHFDRLVDYQLEPSLYSPSVLQGFSKTLKKKKVDNYPIHLKCNTGLNRIGLSTNELTSFLEVKNNFPFSIKSVYSHLGASENESPNAYTQGQIDCFLEMKAAVVTAFQTPPLFHLLNTSGIFNYPEHQMDVVRTGIGLYGFANRSEWDESLQPIAELSAPIVQIHTVKKGESVGYNLGWTAKKESRVAVLPLGHADGISRRFGKEVGAVWINGEKAPIVGNVCMDMLMIDVSSIACSVNDRAIVFNALYPVSDFAQQAGTISYELLAALSPRIKRSYRRLL